MSDIVEIVPGVVGRRFEPASDPAPRFRLIPFREIVLSTMPDYLIKGLIPRAGLVVVWGPPKCGKSFWTFDAVMHVALGWPYRGRKVKQGVVVYFVLEGDAGFKARKEAFRKQYLKDHDDEVQFYEVATRLDLIADAEELIASIKAQLGETLPDAVVIDTLNRSLAGSESSDEAMGKYIKAADAIREAFNCAVIIVHHCGIAGDRPRGHTSLTGAADAQLAVKMDDAHNIEVTLECMKDGPEGETIVSRLVPIDVGIDDESDPIASCFVEPAQAIIGGGSKPPSRSTKVALSALVEALDEHGVYPAPRQEIPPNIKAVTKAQWRQRAYLRGISDSNEPRAREQAFKRAYDRLLADRQIAVWDELVWLT